jgi:hypothetical protein
MREYLELIETKCSALEKRDFEAEEMGVVYTKSEFTGRT